jgi:uncharacterized protein (TIRG00374 family)
MLNSNFMRNILFHRSWWLSLAFIISSATLVLALRDVDLCRSFTIVQHANPGLLALAGIVFSGSYVVRALRWYMLLENECNMKPRVVFWATTIGYLYNSLLPARAGDVIRALAVSYWTGVSKSFVLASVFVERIAEVTGIALVSLLVLSVTEGAPDWINMAARLMTILSGVGIAILFLVPDVGKRIGRSLSITPVHHPRCERVIQTFQQVLRGFRTLRDAMQVARLAVVTMMIWFLETWFTILIAQALGLPIGGAIGLLLLCALSLASVVPSTPGSIGVFQFVAVTMLTPFGFSPDDAIAYIVMFQLVQYLMVMIWGGFGLWRLAASGLSLRRLREETTTIRQEVDHD